MSSLILIKIIAVLTIFLIKGNTATSSNEKQDAKCLLPVEPGPCRMKLNRFYYNSQTDTCEEFTFGGCRGNDNKFGFKETCEAACKKSPSSTEPATISSPTEINDNPVKQLKPGTLKTLTSKLDVSSVTTTTPKPGTIHTTVKTKAATPISGVISTTKQHADLNKQKLK